MSWLDRLFGTKESSSSVAKRRLQMVLIHDRSDLPAGLLEEIKDEIIDVIARRLAIDSANVIVHLEQTSHENRLIAEVPLAPVNGRRRAAAATR
jgi:cell division topological specificity factor